jgi:protein TonB
MNELSTHAEKSTGRTERRVFPRQPVQSLAYVNLGEGNGGIVLEVSEGGMAVQAVVSLVSDDLPRICVQTSHSDKPIEAKGHIAWSSDLRKLVGVQFVDLSEKARLQLRTWISAEAAPKVFRGQSTIPIERNSAKLSAQGVRAAGDPIAEPFSLGGGPAGTKPGLTLFAESDPASNLMSVTDLLRPEEPLAVESRVAADFGILKKWQWLLGAMAIAAVLVGAFFILPGKRSFAPFDGKSTPPIDSHLGLKLDRSGTDWRLSWDPNAPAVAKATKGQLFVSDGKLRNTVQLDASDLHSGTIVYSPATNDVSWTLQVGNTSNPTEQVSEAVQIVAGLPVPPPTAQEPTSSEDSVRKLAVSKSVSAPTVGLQPTSSPTGTGSRASTPTPSAHAAAIGLPVATVKAQPQSAAVLHGEQSAGQSSGSKHTSEGRDGIVQPAQLVFSINPDYPELAKQGGISGTVEVSFKIDANGAVRDVRVIKGPAVLAQAAVTAVADRKYRPTRVDGVPIETEASAVFKFTPN